MADISQTRQFIADKIAQDVKLLGNTSAETIGKIADAWLDDDVKPSVRYQAIRAFVPEAKKILDMASGAGGFVFYGLKNGYDVYGLEPEAWKSELIKMKINDHAYPSEWANHFAVGVGEKMHYADQSFDVVASYQTIEHVQNVNACLHEMLRVTKSGGAIIIQCPNYLSTFEPHYELPWLPLFPRCLAKKYLKLCGANPAFLDTLNYTTTCNVKRSLRKAAQQQGRSIRIENLHRLNIQNKLKDKGVGWMVVFYPIYLAALWARNLFRAVNDVNLLVRVDS